MSKDDNKAYDGYTLRPDSNVGRPLVLFHIAGSSGKVPFSASDLEDHIRSGEFSGKDRKISREALAALAAHTRDHS